MDFISVNHQLVSCYDDTESSCQKSTREMSFIGLRYE